MDSRTEKRMPRREAASDAARTGEKMVERKCLLFEAGDYADRGVTVTPGDLWQIAQNSPKTLPVRIEHLRESPFDAALGTVTGLQAVGTQLWGILRQPLSAWRFVRRAGARSLSVALDTLEKRLTEVSFVCRPRVAAAQVFGTTDGERNERVIYYTAALAEAGLPGEEETMAGVRQFADSVVQYIRAQMGGMERDGTEEETFAAERAQVAAEREAVQAERVAQQAERVAQQIMEFKRQGALRATDTAERLARALLMQGEPHRVQFGEQEVSLAGLFAQFLAANGAVVPMGEAAASDRTAGLAASDRLIALAQEAVRQSNTSYPVAFAKVSAAHPELARAAREETLRG